MQLFWRAQHAWLSSRFLSRWGQGCGLDVVLVGWGLLVLDRRGLWSPKVFWVLEEPLLWLCGVVGVGVVEVVEGVETYGFSSCLA